MLCLSLSRGIDFELANVETLSKDIEHLSLLLKQMYIKESGMMNYQVAMILMMSFKNAFKLDGSLSN
jgi:hypothetical protein